MGLLVDDLGRASPPLAGPRRHLAEIRWEGGISKQVVDPCYLACFHQTTMNAVSENRDRARFADTYGARTSLVLARTGAFAGKAEDNNSYIAPAARARGCMIQVRANLDTGSGRASGSCVSEPSSVESTSKDDMAHRKTPLQASEWKENCQKVEMHSCGTTDAVKQKESPSDDADTSACAGDDHNVQDTPLSPKTHPNSTGKNKLYPMNSQSNLHPRAYKALNPQFLNPMYEPAVSSAAELQADSCDGVLRNELQADNCDDILPYEVFYEETDCSNNGASATATESGKTVEKAVVVDDIEPCQDDTPSTKNTQRNAPTSHENGNNVGQQNTTCGCKFRQKLWIKPVAVTAANLVLSTIIFLAIFYTSCQGCTCPQLVTPSRSRCSGGKIVCQVFVSLRDVMNQSTFTFKANNSAVAHPTPWKSTVPKRNVTANELLTVETEGQTEKPDNKDGQQTHTDPVPPAVNTRQNYFSDCSEIHTAKNGYGGVSDGVYKILPVGLTSPISVYCDQTTDGGGWTVIQRRFDGSVDFNRPYNAFKYGFGSANGEQWLDLENMYRLTNQQKYTLYVQLEDWNSVVKYAKYSSFSVGSSSNYGLYVSGYSGSAGDGFYVSDSGAYLSASHVLVAGVPTREGGGTGSALNGPYLRPSDYTGNSGWGIAWAPFGGSYWNYLKKSKMMGGVVHSFIYCLFNNPFPHPVPAPCEEPNCNNTYIGETSRPLKVRYKEHCRPSANGYSSAIFHHLQHNQGHSFKLESTDILDRETRWWERGVKEAIYERMYNPTLNREGGLRVDLSGTWDLALPAPRTDNT
ncbi:hypothetical protein Bbelb_118550 [Branchiostoma belcheri]|nr:hypothetical protein Bbelb_118550 [Branchiostoma belcheri]